MKSIIELMAENNVGPIELNMILYMLFHSIILGTLLLVSTHFLSKKLKQYTVSSGLELKDAKKKEVDPVDQILGASNLLFVSVGLTGVMLLVNNNFVRAFAILSALAIVRFRVKLNQANGLTSSLLFSMLVGMACGVQELKFAWAITGVYLVLCGFVVLTVKITAQRKTRAKEALRQTATVEELRPRTELSNT